MILTISIASSTNITNKIMADLTFVPSGRGGRKVIRSGYIYTRHRAQNNGSIWHCTQRHSGCKGRILINAQEDSAQVIKVHNHLPDFGTVKAERLVAAAKRRLMAEPNILPALITRDTFSNADDEALISMPNEGSLKRSLQRLRRRDNPPLPSSLEELENIPERYRSINGTRWFLHDSVGSDNRFLLFGSQSALNQMSRSRMWYMDGTFKSRPLLFAQLYVVHYEYQEHVIPGI